MYILYLEFFFNVFLSLDVFIILELKNKNKPLKELSLCHKLRFFNFYIFAAQCHRPQIFQVSNKKGLYRQVAKKQGLKNQSMWQKVFCRRCFERAVILESFQPGDPDLRNKNKVQDRNSPGSPVSRSSTSRSSRTTTTSSLMRTRRTTLIHLNQRTQSGKN